MPLLVCPNDSAAMQSVQRSGVEFDFCPTCRGVWLDRGELEKLMAVAAAPEAEAAPTFYRQRQDERREYGRPDDDLRREPRRKKGFSLFDIFD